MDISLVILTWNSQEYFEKCFDSVLSSLTHSGLEYEIFIVDNGSKDQTVQLLNNYQSRCENLTIIFLNENIGTTKSRNMALRRCSGDYVCILDSDVEIKGNIFPSLIARIKENAQVGLIVPRIIYPSGKWQKSIDQFPTFFHKLRRFFFLRQIENIEAANETDNLQEKTVDYAISAFWLFRRDLLKKVGFLDEKYFYAPEDVDYCLSVWKANFSVLYFPTAEVVHHTQEISRGLKLNKAKKEHIKGLIYYFFKHGYFFRSPKNFFQENDHPKVLCVTYQFPPIAGPATQRHLRFITRLSEFDWIPVILTVRPEKAAEYVMLEEHSLNEEIRNFIQYRANSFNPMEYFLAIKNKNSREKHRSNSPADNANKPDRHKELTSSQPSKFQMVKDALSELFRVPDMMNGWIPFAVFEGFRAMRKHQCRAIYASGGPWSALLVGYFLSTLSRKPLICDFRDPWLRNPYRKKKSSYIDRFESYLEQKVVGKSRFVIANTEKLLSDFRSHYPQEPMEKFVHISNGYDERLFKTDNIESPTDAGRFVIRHVGSLYGPRAPVALLNVISTLKNKGVLSADNFSLEFIGRVNADCLTAESLRQLGIQDLVKLTAPVPHKEAIKAILTARALLIVQPDTDLQIPGKLFEYIAARKPVIALACSGATADLVHLEKLGMVAEPNDEDAIEDILMTFMNRNNLEEKYNIENPAKYESRVLTKKLVDLLNGFSDG